MRLALLFLFAACAVKQQLTQLERDEMRAWHAKFLMDEEAAALDAGQP